MEKYKTEGLKILKDDDTGQYNKSRILEFVTSVNENFAKHEHTLIEIKHKINDLTDKSQTACIDINSVKKLLTILETTVGDIKENLLKAYNEIDVLDTKFSELLIEYRTNAKVLEATLVTLPDKQQVSVLQEKLQSIQKEIAEHTQNLNKFEIEYQKLIVHFDTLQKVDIAEIKKKILEHTALHSSTEKTIHHLKEKHIATFKMLKTINGDIKNIIERIKTVHEQLSVRDKELKEEIDSAYNKAHKEITSGLNYVIGVTDILTKKIESLDVDTTLKRLAALEKKQELHHQYIKTVALNLKEIKQKYSNLLEIQEFFITVYNTGMFIVELLILRKVNKERLNTISKSKSIISVFILVTIGFYILGVIFGKDGFFYTIYKILHQGMELLRSAG